jgi:hypothetical protein
MSEETKPTGCRRARRRASRCVLLPFPLTVIARRLDDGYLSLTAPRLRPRQRIGQRRARHRMPVAWTRGAGAGEVPWRHPDTFVDSTIEHHTGFPGGAGASGLPSVTHFLSVCRASHLAEARCISSPVPGRIACKDVGFFETFSCPWTLSPPFDTLLEIERIFFSAKRNKRANAITRGSPLLTSKPHRAFSAMLTSHDLPRTGSMGGGSRHIQSQKHRHFRGHVTEASRSSGARGIPVLGLHCTGKAAERGAIDEVPKQRAQRRWHTAQGHTKDLDAQHRRHDDLGDTP